MSKLPETINPGGPVEVQIAPPDEYPNMDQCGNNVVQRIDETTIRRLL